MNCPYCEGKTKFMTTKEFYGKDYGKNMYVCKPCNAYVGTHGRSASPLGTIANAELREYRKKAHAKFDPLWKSGRMSRRFAYKLLSERLEIQPNKAHIGMFDIEQCKKVLEKF